jgi:hypothetical protein
MYYFFDGKKYPDINLDNKEKMKALIFDENILRY